MPGAFISYGYHPKSCLHLAWGHQATNWSLDFLFLINPFCFSWGVTQTRLGTLRSENLSWGPLKPCFPQGENQKCQHQQLAGASVWHSPDNKVRVCASVGSWVIPASSRLLDTLLASTLTSWWRWCHRLSASHFCCWIALALGNCPFCQVMVYQCPPHKLALLFWMPT